MLSSNPPTIAARSSNGKGEVGAAAEPALAVNGVRPLGTGPRAAVMLTQPPLAARRITALKVAGAPATRFSVIQVSVNLSPHRPGSANSHAIVRFLPGCPRPSATSCAAIRLLDLASAVQKASHIANRQNSSRLTRGKNGAGLGLVR